MRVLNQSSFPCKIDESSHPVCVTFSETPDFNTLQTKIYALFFSHDILFGGTFELEFSMHCFLATTFYLEAYSNWNLTIQNSFCQQLLLEKG
jgi:hypothetical protein